MKRSDAQVWLCILNMQNFEILRKERVYGVPTNACNRLEKVRVGDTLLFYVTSPVKSILGMSRAASSMFEEKQMAPWNDRHYPFRVRISDVEETAIPSKAFVGKIAGIKKRIPMGQSLIAISQSDLVKILSKARS
jgi:predicted RNA-binding protein